MSSFDPQLHSQLNYVHKLNFLLSTILLPIVLFMIVLRSSTLGKYRYYLLNTTIWNYVLTAVIFGIDLTFLFPSLCILGSPILELNHNQYTVAVCFAIFCAIGLMLSICCSLLYRYSQASYGPFEQLLNKTPWTETFYVVVYLLFQTVSLGSIFMQKTPGGEQTRNQFMIENPKLIAYSIDKPVICFANTEKTRRFVYVLYTNKQNLRSFQLQMMLLKVVVLQLHVFYILLLFPTYAFCLLVYTQYPRGGYYSTIIVAFMSSHCWLDYLTLLYVVVPYRETIRKALHLRSQSSQVVSIR
ncbi:hypothetical protein M3Y94_00012200 [Aphelenchoides besseyi]|nr:hypothetical protein M3Y94_00012200 [Aphelenchoides besseyi]